MPSTQFLVAKNRANSELDGAISSGATSLTVKAGEGANFPSTYPFNITIDDEIFKCTNRVTDVLTVVSAQESTSAATHSDGAQVSLNITAKAITDLNTAVNFVEKYADYALSFWGKVTEVTDSTHFKVSGLAGLGASVFLPASGMPHEILVFKADGAAPQGEQTPVVAYTTGDGTFQHAAFTQLLVVDDEVQILTPLLASLGTKATAAATGAVSSAKYMAAYQKQVVTLLLDGTIGLSNLKTLIDAIPTTMVGTDNAALASVLEDAMQKATAPAYNQDTDSLEALRELLDTIAGYLTPEVADILTDTGTTLPALLATIQADLDNPNQYKANVAALALEATLTAIKGGGWSTETLVAIKAAIDAIPTTMRGTDNAATVADGWDAALATILDNFSAARIGYLDQLDFALQEAIAALQTDLDNPSQYMADLSTLETRLSAVRAGYLDELAAANLPTDIAALNTLLSHATYGLSALKTLADAIITDIASAVPEPPTAKSLQDILHKDTNYTFDHTRHGLEAIADEIHEMHAHSHILFITPEAVDSITADNIVIKAELAKIGAVDHITQSDALDFPNFTIYDLCVMGSNNGNAWTTANLADIKVVPMLPLLCFDKVAAAYLEMGTDGGDATTKTTIDASAKIEASELGIGASYFSVIGLIVGVQTISSSATYHTLNMENANLSEIVYATADLDVDGGTANQDVVLGWLPAVLENGTIGLDEAGAELPATIAFFGAGFEAANLTTLGKAVIYLCAHILVQAQKKPVEIAGTVQNLRKLIFGNMGGGFGNTDPLVEYIAGKDSVGGKLPVGTSLPDLVTTIDGIVDGIKTSQDRQLFTMDFWSDTQEELLINATQGDKTLPTVTVADLPAGATIVRAIAMFKFRMVENVYAGANAINVAQHIQVRDDTPGAWRDAISIADNLFNFSEAAREGGDVLIGDHDIAVEVDANDGYNFQWASADADQISINFNDVQVGLRIWYSV